MPESLFEEVLGSAASGTVMRLYDAEAGIVYISGMVRKRGIRPVRANFSNFRADAQFRTTKSTNSSPTSTSWASILVRSTCE